uniref:Uncharacterized protein n=1 Tax=Bicosoecida sp. CB-2014 TaxID=1486930 RepID=A0A7S1CI81_9STRA|mmetsp:Transcript_27691/g.95809  ORF Transcript_27691/g.95809 Transcript_27691/m.95809 type:complete len:170 (+) Transcript_27691:181-690(+)
MAVTPAFSRTVTVLLVVMVIVEFVFVYRAATVLPAAANWPSILDGKFRRKECTMSVKGGKREGSWRDCRRGEGAICSLEEPCTPCYDTSEEPCRPCSINNWLPKECHFVEGVGPYCRDANGTVAPCVACCSWGPPPCCHISEMPCADVVVPDGAPVPTVLVRPMCPLER